MSTGRCDESSSRNRKKRFLGFEPCDTSEYNSENSRNSYYTRTLKGKYGILHLKMPMDRKGLFSQKPLSFYELSKLLNKT
ncbi:MAG: transposase [Finegoldia sp.]|uniref:transposase n=1 Tax=Finegoldia sp. TaxID=1981334 RepID=UPI0039967E07